jgi:predicted RecA/RadA family phage recombinase
MRRKHFRKILFAFGSTGFSSRLFCSALKEISAGAAGTGVSSACFGGLPRLRNSFMARGDRINLACLVPSPSRVKIEADFA